jgi:peptide/nickel transport system substrate-binding protein
MRTQVIASMAVFLIVISLNPCTALAASPAGSTPKKPATPSTQAKPSISTQTASTPATMKNEQPQTGGIFRVILRNTSNVFGYPPSMVSAARDYAPPFFDRLVRIGDDGEYKPDLALSWDVSKDGKAITFKLRKGVVFHDGTPFNAEAVKFNIDNLIAPKGTLLDGITSVDVVDDYTVRLNLLNYNNLVFLHLATNPVTYIYSPAAVKKNGVDWATTHPVGTGPFILKDYEPNSSLTLVKNPNYWQKGLPYLDGMKIIVVPNPMTQIVTLKAGQAHAIYDVPPASASQLRAAGYTLQWSKGGSIIGINFDISNSEILSKPQVRQAIEYAIDKEAICSGPGEGLYEPAYQIAFTGHPDYDPALRPRRYDPGRAKKLLEEAGYPNGFGFKLFIQDTSWKDGWVAVQNYLNAVGIKMEINTCNISAYNLIRTAGKIEKGAAALGTYPMGVSALFALDSYWRSDLNNYYPHSVKPPGIDKLIDQAKSSRDPEVVRNINRQIIKLIYEDETIVPFYVSHRNAVVDGSVRNTGWFIAGDDKNNELGIRTWLKK